MLTEAYLLKKYGPLLTVEHVAELLHKAPGTLRNQIAQGRSPVTPAKIGAKDVFHYAAVARYLDSIDESLAGGQSTAV